MSWNITDAEKLEDAILKLKLRLVMRIGVRAGMTVVDVGCGQGGLTASLAKTVGKRGKVLAVDVSKEYFDEFNKRLNKHGIKDVVTFIQADAANLEGVLASEIADAVASYRFLEELKQPEAMPRIIGEMARIAKKGGKVSIIELCTESKNEAEGVYIRLHRDSGDSLFGPFEIVNAMERAKLSAIRMETIQTDVWISPELAKQDLSHAQVWFDADVEKNLGRLIDEFGMKYPALIVFSGVKK